MKVSLRVAHCSEKVDCFTIDLVTDLDDDLQAHEGIWGTGVFTAYELKTLTRRRFPYRDSIHQTVLASILSNTNGVITAPYAMVKDDSFGEGSSTWLSPGSSLDAPSPNPGRYLTNQVKVL